jgi:hypothetical protein
VSWRKGEQHDAGETSKPRSINTTVKAGPVIGIQAYPFSLTDIRLLDGPFKQAMERDLKYMLSLEPVYPGQLW